MKTVICQYDKYEMEQTKKLLDGYGRLHSMELDVSCFDSPFALCMDSPGDYLSPCCEDCNRKEMF